MINGATREMLLSISKCQASTTGCGAISQYQKEHGISDYAPVPWQGHIELAKILFISSNPSELKDGVHARRSWSDDQTVDFFEHRFAERDKDTGEQLMWSSKGGTQYRLYPLTPPCLNDQQTWIGTQVWADEICRKCGLTNIKAGETYALTEVVHCYSKKNKGVKEALISCSRHLDSVLECANNSVILAVMGDSATSLMSQYLASHYDVRQSKLDWRPLEQKKEGVGLLKVKLSGRERLIVALPHASPSNRAYSKELDKYLTQEEISALINLFM
jgi:hypothetical protein